MTDQIKAAEELLEMALDTMRSNNKGFDWLRQELFGSGYVKANSELGQWMHAKISILEIGLLQNQRG